MIEITDLGSRPTRVLILALLLASCVIFGKALETSLCLGFLISKTGTTTVPASWGGLSGFSKIMQIERSTQRLSHTC